MSTPLYQEIIDAINKATHVALVSHRGPDGDTLGSSLALAHYIEALEKKYTVFCVDEAPPSLQFLPKSNEVGPLYGVWQDPTVDLVIVVDASDLKHCGVAKFIPPKGQRRWPVINIDHHHTNGMYGDINLVDGEASSTCEIVFSLLDSIDVIDKHIATCLLTGVITDTGSFSNLATTASSVHAASRLLSRGANLGHISKNTLHHRPVNTLRLWGRALERLHDDPRTGMIVTIVTLADIEECDVDPDSVAGLSNFLNSLEQAAERAVLVLSQTEPGTVKGSLRTTNPLIDVSEFAKVYGGGGHKKAAGFNLTGTLEYTPNGYTITNTTPSN